MEFSVRRRKSSRGRKSSASSESSESSASSESSDYSEMVHGVTKEAMVAVDVIHQDTRSVLICMVPESNSCVYNGPVVLGRDYDDDEGVACFKRIFPPEDNPSFEYPTRLVRDHGFGFACLNSRLYFVGGHNSFPSVSFTHVAAYTPGQQISSELLLQLPPPEPLLSSTFNIYNQLTEVCFNDVSVFDLVSNLWQHDFPSMKTPRSSPIVLTHDDRLYVFGSKVSYACPEDFSLSPDTFAECYDFSTREWSYIAPAPRDMLSPVIVSHAYSESKELVYFWVYGRGIFSYNFKSQTWSPFKTKECGKFHPRLGLIWSASAVLLEYRVGLRWFLLWNNFGIIYCYDFSTDTAQPIYTFKNRKSKFGCIKDMPFPSPSYLINAGGGKFCLLYNQHHPKDKDSVWCHTLDISSAKNRKTRFSLTHRGCKVLYPKGYSISSVFTMKIDDFLQLGNDFADSRI